MAKDPAFLFYPGDWQGGTFTFSRFLKGCYMDVLIAQFNNGHLALEEIKTVLGSDFGQAWPAIQKKFNKDQDGLFFNVKLETEMTKRKEYSKSRARNRASKKDMKHISNTHVDTHVSHVENEIENEDGFKIKKELIDKSELCEAIFTDERYITDLEIAHKGKDLMEAWNECWAHHSVAVNPPVEVWEWKQKLNTWLTIKGKNKTNGTSKTKQQRAAESLAVDYAKLYSSKPGG